MRYLFLLVSLACYNSPTAPSYCQDVPMVDTNTGLVVSTMKICSSVGR